MVEKRMLMILFNSIIPSFNSEIVSFHVLNYVCRACERLSSQVRVTMRFCDSMLMFWLDPMLIFTRDFY